MKTANLLIGLGLGLVFAAPKPAEAWWARGGRGGVYHAPAGGTFAYHSGGWAAGGYRPPAYHGNVNVYPGYYHAPVGAAVAAGATAGLVAGVTAGAIASASRPPAPVYYGAAPVVPVYPAVGFPPPAVASPGPLAIGQQLPVLPQGCTVQPVGPTTYYRCGTAWLQAYMQGNSVLYAVVPPPG